MKILVTGAGGFVCRHIVTTLSNAGHNIIALDQQFDPDLRLEWRSGVEFLQSDLSTLPDMQVDALIHGAAVTGSMLDLAPERVFRANLDPALLVMRWATDHADRALFISSGAVYEKTAPGPVRETDPASPLGLYATAKYTIERLVETNVHDYGRAWAAIRLSNIYGTGEISRPTRPRLSLIGNMVKDAVAFGRVNVLAYEPARDWTFAADIGRAVVALLSVPAWSHALYNIASEQRITSAEVADRLRKLIPWLSRNTLEQIPAGQVQLSRLGYLANSRLVEQTGFNTWTPIDEGLRQSVLWAQRAKAAV